MKKTRGVGIALAILAAALYAINSPFSKLLLDYMPPTLSVLLSFVVFDEQPQISFYIALCFMAVGAWLCSSDKPLFRKKR